MISKDDVEIKVKIYTDISLYKERGSRFGGKTTTNMTETTHPLQWWDIFGVETVELRKRVRRILSLYASASSCERNWSTFAHFHTKTRNRLSVARLNSLVYINYNRKLAERFETNKLLIESDSKKYDVIHVDEFNLSSEWMAGESRTCNEFVYGEECLTWADVEETIGVAEHPGPSTRSGHARPFTIQAPVEVVEEQQQEEETVDTNAFDRLYRCKK